MRKVAMILVSNVECSDNLKQIVSDINRASWDEANDITPYDASCLQNYLALQDTVFITCYEASATASTLLGIASGRVESKPYGKERWLYVDEVDVCADHRRKGVGKLLMRKLFEIAKEHGCEELWLATEVDNIPANALYQSLKPHDIAEVVGYTYETKT